MTSRGGRRTAPLDLSVLADAPARRLLGAQWASLSGDWAMLAALPFVVYSLGGGVEEVGVAFALGAFSMFCLVLLGGVLADRHGRRTMMIVAEGMRLATQGVLAVLLLLGSARLWQVMVAEVSIGAGSALAQPALSGLIAEIVPARHLQSANAMRGMLGSVAMLSGPALAGAALLLGGPGAAVALDALSFALSAILLLRIAPPTRAGRPTETSSLLAGLRAGWVEFSGRTWLWSLVAMFALFNMLVFGPFEVLGSSIARHSLGGAGAWSAILLAFGLGEVVGSLAALTWRPARPLLAVALLVLAWLPLLLALGVGAPLAAILAGAVITGAAWLLLTAIWESTMQAQVPRAQLSRVSSYDWLGATALMPLGFLLAGPVEATVGAADGMLLAAGVVVAATAAVLTVPEVRRMAAPERGARRAAGRARNGAAEATPRSPAAGRRAAAG